MSTRIPLSGWMVALALLPAMAAAQERTEREIVDLIVRDGPQAQAIRQETEVVRREQLARLAYPNPGVTYSREGAGFAEFYQAEQSLRIFGIRAALSEAGQAATAAAASDRDAQLWALRAEASSAVARLSAAQARTEVASGYFRDVERLIEVLRTREREGEGSRFDRLRAEQELHDARREVTAARIAAAEANAVINGLLPRDVALGRVVPATLAVAGQYSWDGLATRAVAARAELRGLVHAAERADREADAARRLRLPSPTLFGGVKRADVDSDRQFAGVFGVSVSAPLFDRGNREATRWLAERGRLETERVWIERRIRSEVEAAFIAFELRRAAVMADQTAAGEELLQIAEVAYREGEMGILELLDAARTAWRSRIRSAELRLEARLAEIALERAVGEVLWL